MLPDSFTFGPCWRCAGMGTVEVYFLGAGAAQDTAQIYSRVTQVNGKRRWAHRPMLCPIGDLFSTREEALAEFRRRRDQRAA